MPKAACEFAVTTALLRDEAVADTRNRVDVMGLLGVALDLLAQPVDMSVDGAGLDLDLVAPDLAKQLATADHLASLRCEQGEEVELGQGEGDFLAVAPHLTAVHVDDEAWELEARLGLLLCHGLLAAAQVCTNPG